MTLRLQQQCSCVVCDLDRLDGYADRATDLALFGKTQDPYAVCPSCLRIFLHTPVYTDPEYRRLVRVFLYERHQIVVREPMKIGGAPWGLVV